MSNPSLSMWHKTPQEWAEETRDLQIYTRGMATFPLLKTEAYLRTIVVHFYLDPQRYKLGLDPDMEALFELDDDQCLDLTKIAQRWGLETCVAIDPRRWIFFEGAREDKLSGFAVQTLFDKDGAITVVERPASPRALAIRARRRAVLAVYNPIASAVIAILTFLDAFTNTLYRPIDYALAPVGRAYDSWHKSYEEWYAEGFAPDSWEEEGLHGIIRLCKRILWLCLFAFLGWVAWQLRRDAYCNRTYMCDAKIW